MSIEYTSDQLKRCIGKILMAIGWHSINTVPLEILTQVLYNYISQITRRAVRYSNEFGQTQTNFDHLCYIFDEMGIEVGDLENYTKYVDFCSQSDQLPNYPLQAEDHLNFLKPGSQEVLTRPVYIHEHLPPMMGTIPDVKDAVNGSVQNGESTSPVPSEPEEVFKKPVEPPIAKIANGQREPAKPIREILSVIMTSSGFISPAREGKLPESRTPIDLIIEEDEEEEEVPPPEEAKQDTDVVENSANANKTNLPNGNADNNDNNKNQINGSPTSTSPTVSNSITTKSSDNNNTTVPNDNETNRVESTTVARSKGATTTSNKSSNNSNVKKSIKTLKRKKEKITKENVNGRTLAQKYVKNKLQIARGALKAKQGRPSLKSSRSTGKQSKTGAINLAMNDNTNLDTARKPLSPNTLLHETKISKALAAARLKTEKLNTTITPITIRPLSNVNNSTGHVSGISNGGEMKTANGGDTVDKLLTEPDKKKVNIFKKISNVKNETKGRKADGGIRYESRESSPDLVIDETDDLAVKLSQLPSDVTIEPINTTALTTKQDTNYYDDDSHIMSAPLTPKAPENLTQSPPIGKGEKRRRKDTTNKRTKKLCATNNNNTNNKNDQVIGENDYYDDMSRPRTPDAQNNSTNPATKLSNLPLSLPPLPLMGQMGQMPPIPFPFLANFGGPGLIPTNPLFSPLPFPPLNLPNFGQKPFLPNVPSSVTISPTPNSLLRSIKQESPQLSPIPDPPLNPSIIDSIVPPIVKLEKKSKKDKKDKIKKRNKKDKIKNKSEKRKAKEERKEKAKKEKKEKRLKEKELNAALNNNCIANNNNINHNINNNSNHNSNVNNIGGEPTPVKITLKIKSPSSPLTDSSETTRKLNIKPIIRRDDDENDEKRQQRETSPGLAKISALVTGPPKPKPAHSIHVATHSVVLPPRTGPGPGRPRIHPIKQKPTPNSKVNSTTNKKRGATVQKDADGNEVWICPACGRQDDGSPMIGCDGCDAWYHWVCVGIQVPPDDNEDWYCRHCLSRKNEDLQSDKQKKKRKKREKKD